MKRIVGASILVLLLVAAARADAAYFITPTWGRLSSPLGWRADPFRPRTWQHHWGVDIAAPHGTPVLASASGTVRYAGVHAGYGRTVYIDHGKGWTTLYAHLSAIHVRPGQHVAQAAQIGAVGSNGRSTGPHLHFEIRYKDRPVDPMQYLGR